MVPALGQIIQLTAIRVFRVHLPLIDVKHFLPCSRLHYSAGHPKTVSPPPRPRYIQAMTKLLDAALKAARNLRPADQDSIARVVLRLTGMDDEPAIALSTDERAAIAASKAAAARGEFATDDQVRAAWAKHGL
jgi:hypothetical protein